MFKALFFLMAAGTGLSYAAEKPMTWETVLETAYKEAVAAHKPLVVYFYGSNCYWCSRLDSKITFAAPEIAGGAVYVRLNPDYDDAAGNIYKLAKGLNITRYPTVSVLDVSATEVKERWRIVGYKPHEVFFPELWASLSRGPK